MLRRIVTALVGTEPLADAEEAAFLVFSHALPSQSLGFIDARAATLQLTVAGHDLLLRQSPGLLTSHRKEGTTGAGRPSCRCAPSSTPSSTLSDPRLTAL